jgi:hypothetical protein
MTLGESTIYMALIKSLDERDLIAALLHDVSTAHVDVFNDAALKKTMRIVDSRVDNEGISFLTKTLPKLGKALDRALTSDVGTEYLHDQVRFNCFALRLQKQGRDSNSDQEVESELPIFLGEFFNRIFLPSGYLRGNPCVESVRVIRQVCYLFYKYELPYSAEQELEVVNQFLQTEDDLSQSDPELASLRSEIECLPLPESPYQWTMATIARKAQILLERVFERFDPLDIVPCHGPGAVAGKQQLWAKYVWTNVAERITRLYPYDAYFMASLGEVCDTYRHAFSVTGEETWARVLLVPKDSRGPRLISCEPVDFQWVQGGLRKAICELVESHPLTRGKVNFTNQEPNRQAALIGSKDAYGNATLDLKEASDRVSLELVRLLFPPRICEYLECCRSLATTLPDGRVVPLRKFAPMGSSLCFPIMALTIWALLTAADYTEQGLRREVLVYGDDVIVPRTEVRDAIEVLEAFGLKVNADKSCTSGFFRESCGLDAYRGEEVTPVRLRTVWSSSRSPNAYCSWIAYANSFYKKRYFHMYDLIVSRLHAVYGAIPSEDMNLTCPCLADVAPEWLPQRRRTHQGLQKRQWWVWDIKAPRIIHELSGWQMLLRYFTEAGRAEPTYSMRIKIPASNTACEAFRVRSYTRRSASMLVRRWR